MPVGYISIILLLLIILVDIVVSLKLHKLVKTSDVSNILILGIVTMVIFCFERFKLIFLELSNSHYFHEHCCFERLL